MPLDDAWCRLAQALQAQSPSPGTETLPTEQALNRVLAQDLVSAVDVPPHDNSAMDGYALCWADWQGAQDAQGVSVLPQGQRIAAGQVGQPLAAGHCARIFTGAPIPPGADCRGHAGAHRGPARGPGSFSASRITDCP